MYRDGSPADAMLTHWGQRNHTVTELFKHLYALRHFQAMDVVKECVPEKYHKHIKTEGGGGSGLNPAAFTFESPAAPIVQNQVTSRSGH